jgi:hypothetical protein
MALSTRLQSSARRLFPNLKPEQALAELLLERAQKNLIRFQSMSRQFEQKYAQSFDEFRQLVVSGKPSSDQEQDYFDWELAITGIEDMEAEIKRFREISEGA